MPKFLDVPQWYNEEASISYGRLFVVELTVVDVINSGIQSQFRGYYFSTASLTSGSQNGTLSSLFEDFLHELNSNAYCSFGIVFPYSTSALTPFAMYAGNLSWEGSDGLLIGGECAISPETDGSAFIRRIM